MVDPGGTSRHPQPGEREPAITSVDRVGDAIVVRLAGELDLYNADQIRAALLEATAEEPERLVVDLAEVQFIDSTALGVLIEARSRLANRRGFLLAGTRLATRRALEVSGLDRHFALYDSADAALRAQL